MAGRGGKRRTLLIPSVRVPSRWREGGSDGGLFVGQVLEGRNPETAPNGAMHYRENLDVGFSRRRIPQHLILESNL